MKKVWIWLCAPPRDKVKKRTMGVKTPLLMNPRSYTTTMRKLALTLFTAAFLIGVSGAETCQCKDKATTQNKQARAGWFTGTASKGATECCKGLPAGSPGCCKNQANAASKCKDCTECKETAKGTGSTDTAKCKDCKDGKCSATKCKDSKCKDDKCKDGKCKDSKCKDDKCKDGKCKDDKGKNAAAPKS